MNPLVDFLFRALLVLAFLALVASVICGRLLTDREDAVHDPRRCADCARLRHPANQETRAALSTIPRQTRMGEG